MLEALGEWDVPTRSRLEILHLMAGNWPRVRELVALDEVQAYQAALDPRSWESWPAAASRVTTLLELAQLQDQIGDTENARRHYQEYLDHWGDADPPVIAADEARARLAEL
jgi:hypothetical protein